MEGDKTKDAATAAPESKEPSPEYHFDWPYWTRKRRLELIAQLASRFPDDPPPDDLEGAMNTSIDDASYRVRRMTDAGLEWALRHDPRKGAQALYRREIRSRKADRSRA